MPLGRSVEQKHVPTIFVGVSFAGNSEVAMTTTLQLTGGLRARIQLASNAAKIKYFILSPLAQLVLRRIYLELDYLKPSIQSLRDLFQS